MLTLTAEELRELTQRKHADAQRAVLGHKSTATTKRYAHYGVARLAEALKRRG